MADGPAAPRSTSIDETLKGYEADIAKLQGKLREARARQNAIATRFESAVTRAKAREMLNGSRTEDAFSRFEVLERRADFAEGRADALGMTGPKSLEEEIAELQRRTTGRCRTGSHEGRAEGQGGVRHGRCFVTADRRRSILFIGLPWLIFHYITKWKTGGDADRVRREAARRAARRRAAARRPAVHDRADHDRREPDWRQQCLPEDSSRQRLLERTRSERR